MWLLVYQGVCVVIKVWGGRVKKEIGGMKR